MEAIAEPGSQTTEPAESPQIDSVPVRQASPASVAARFTSANAREMAAKGHAARRERIEQLRKAAEPDRNADESYKAQRLARVRKQLDRIDSLMEKEIDPQKLDRLASAQARLSEQERILAGRPLPGSHRPSRNPKSQTPAQSSFQPTE